MALRFRRDRRPSGPAGVRHHNAVREPAHFALLEWRKDRIAGIRDFLYAPYVLDGIDWVRLA
jgi:hypothetical protein